MIAVMHGMKVHPSMRVPPFWPHHTIRPWYLTSWHHSPSPANISVDRSRLHWALLQRDNVLEVWDTTHLRKAGGAVSDLAGAGIPPCFISAKARGILRGDKANGLFEVHVVLLYTWYLVRFSYQVAYFLSVFSRRRACTGEGSEVLKTVAAVDKAQYA